MTTEDLSFIQKQIGYEFKNKMLLQQAFIRRSYSQEHPNFKNNEVLEFIGDKALDFIIVRALAEYYGDYTKNDEYSSELKEGKLTEIKNQLVKGSMLASRINLFGFQDYLIMGKGDRHNNIQEDSHVKEDLFEAIVGAVALDSDWDVEALDTAIGLMLDYEYYLDEGFSDSNNFTARIQQWCQKEHLAFPEYEFAETDRYGINQLLRRTPYPVLYPNSYSGLYHGASSNINSKEHFVCCLHLESIKQDFYASGNSKSESRMNAAESAYNFLKENDMLFTIHDEIEEPTLQKAVSQLHELAQKGYIAMPNYEFEENHNTNGNPIWTCECWIDGIDGSFANTSPSKKECKRKSAYEMLMFILGENTEDDY